jgi:hypothetical protein
MRSSIEVWRGHSPEGNFTLKREQRYEACRYAKWEDA